MNLRYFSYPQKEDYCLRSSPQTVDKLGAGCYAQHHFFIKIIAIVPIKIINNHNALLNINSFSQMFCI